MTAAQAFNPVMTSERVAAFWEKVDRSGGPDACWPWTGTRHPQGYGAFYCAEGKQYAHRVAVVLSGRVLRAQELACHRCDNPPCCNPSHLFVGTALDNIRDRDAKGRGRRGRPGGAAGERNPNAKLTEAAVREIRVRLSAGEVQASIGQRYGVGPEAIRLIAIGDHWRHVK